MEDSTLTNSDTKSQNTEQTDIGQAETGQAEIIDALSKEQLEQFDVLDEHGQITGEKQTRFKVHKEGLWHRSIHLWIVKEERYILFQRRSKKKDLEGGKVDVTVGGHFAAGENFIDVLREADEEVGLSVSPSELHYLHTQQAERFYPNQDSPERIDREFQEVYFCHCDQALSDYFLNPDEVDVLYEVPLDAAIALYEDGEPILAAGYDSQNRNNNAMLIEEDLIEQARAHTLTSLKAIKADLNSQEEKLAN